MGALLERRLGAHSLRGCLREWPFQSARHKQMGRLVCPTLTKSGRTVLYAHPRRLIRSTDWRACRAKVGRRSGTLLNTNDKAGRLLPGVKPIGTTPSSLARRPSDVRIAEDECEDRSNKSAKVVLSARAIFLLSQTNARLRAAITDYASLLPFAPARDLRHHRTGRPLQ